ncbi:hypothetical protein [Maribacter halichondriae]|uniref:hypothetical protein n=1 Tax=Maribacter halichondriae TaxID=2980554 RepID=UPI0030763DC8
MKSYLRTKDHSVSQEEFELLYDENSEMLVTRPIPDNLEDYYKSESYISHTDSRKTMVDKMYHAIKSFSLWRKLSLIDRYALGTKKILDVGAGTGDFLMAAKKRGGKSLELNRTKTRECVLGKSG